MAEQTPAPKLPNPPADKTATKVAGPKEITREIPDGAIPMNLVEPGYGPLEGSPKENDPTQLANPNNPISPVTRPVNPSNPANMPQTQSEKPASEQRIWQDQEAKAKGKTATPETETQKKVTAEKLELTKKVGEALAKHGGNESGIPASDSYWADLNRLRILSNP